MPKVFFKIVSVDFRDRHTIEGYGFIRISQKPGCFVHHLETWKPAVEFDSKLTNFLVGGCPELDDIQYLYHTDVSSSNSETNCI